MGWQEDQYGKDYKSNKTKNKAAKDKNKKEQRKTAAYNNALNKQTADFATKHGLQNSEKLRNAVNTVMTNRKRTEDYTKLNQKHQQNLKDRANRTGNESYHKIKEDDRKKYDSMRKDMGLSKKDGPISKATYSALTADYQARQKDGSVKFLKDVKDGYGVKERPIEPTKFDKKVDKGLEKVGKFIDKTKKFSAKAEKNIQKFKLAKEIGKVGNVVTQLTGLKGKVDTAKLATKGAFKTMDKVDQYAGASSARNVLADITDGKDQSLRDYKKAITQGFTGKRRASGEEIAGNLGIKSKYGRKLAGFGIEAVADPTNLVGVGAYKAGAKAFKGMTKAAKVAKTAEEVSKVAPKVKPNEQVMKNAVKTVSNVPNSIKKVQQDLTIPKSVNTSKIERKPFDHDGQKKELEFIRETAKQEFAKRNEPLVKERQMKAEQEYRKQLEQEIEFEGHMKNAEEYKRIRNSLANKRLNIPEDNHADFATNLSKALYSAKGKGQGDDIYRIAQDEGFDSVDDFVASYGNLFESNKIVSAGKNKFITQQLNEHPDEVIENLFRQTEEAQRLEKSFADLETLKQQQPQPKDPLYMNIDQQPADEIQQALANGQLDPTTAPLARATAQPQPMPKSTPQLGGIVNNGYFPKNVMNDQLQYQKGNINSPNVDPAQTSVKNAYAPEVEANQKMNFDTGQVEKVEPTHMEKMRANADSIIKEKAEHWKNMSSFSMSRETPERVFDGIFKEDSQTMKDMYIEPIKKSESNSVREKVDLKKNIDSMYKERKLSKEDDKLVQMYGEGKIKLDELKQKTKNWKNVADTTQFYKDLYKTLLTRANETLVRNGFDPIPERKDYFPHFNNDGSLLKDIFGIDTTNHNLPTDINGITEDFRPSKNFFGNAQKRKGDKTKFGAKEGLSSYMEGVMNIIHHTDNIKNIRTLEDSIRENFAGTEHLNNVTAWLKNYGDQLAGKKGSFDRAFESIGGRQVYNIAKTLQSNVGKAFTSYNVGSALTGFIPSIFAASQTSKGALTKALFETLQNTVKNDGFIDGSDFLIRRRGADPLYSSAWRKVGDKGYWLMQTIDNFNAQVIVRGKYNELINKGLSHEAAIKKADNFAAGVMADRSKGQMPLIFNQRTLGPITQFQLEVNNQISHIMKDMPKNAMEKADSKGGKAWKVASTFGQLAIYGYLFNTLYEKVTGRRPALDPIDYAMTFQKSINGDVKATELVSKVAGQIPFTSLMVNGRTPIGSGLPSIPDITEQVKMSDGSWGTAGKIAGKMVAERTPYLFVPGYAQGKKTYDGIKAQNEKVPSVKSPSGNIKYLVEDDMPNKLRGLFFGTGGFRETSEYYSNSQRPLGDKQTSDVEKAVDPRAAFNEIQGNRIQNKIDDLAKNPKPSKGDKRKMENLVKRLNKMKGE